MSHAQPIRPVDSGGHQPIIARVMAAAGIQGPQGCPKGLRYVFGIAVVAAGLYSGNCAQLSVPRDLLVPSREQTSATGVP